jgi:hypothetical protein
MRWPVGQKKRKSRPVRSRAAKSSAKSPATRKSRCQRPGLFRSTTRQQSRSGDCPCGVLALGLLGNYRRTGPLSQPLMVQRTQRRVAYRLAPPRVCLMLAGYFWRLIAETKSRVCSCWSSARIVAPQAALLAPQRKRQCRPCRCSGPIRACLPQERPQPR